MPGPTHTSVITYSKILQPQNRDANGEPYYPAKTPKKKPTAKVQPCVNTNLNSNPSEEVPDGTESAGASTSQGLPNANFTVTTMGNSTILTQGTHVHEGQSNDPGQSTSGRTGSSMPAASPQTVITTQAGVDAATVSNTVKTVLQSSALSQPTSSQAAVQPNAGAQRPAIVTATSQPQNRQHAISMLQSRAQNRCPNPNQQGGSVLSVKGNIALTRPQQSQKIVSMAGGFVQEGQQRQVLTAQNVMKLKNSGLLPANRCIKTQDGKLLLQTSSGQQILIEPGGNNYQQQGQVQQPQHQQGQNIVTTSAPQLNQGTRQIITTVGNPGAQQGNKQVTLGIASPQTVRQLQNITVQKQQQQHIQVAGNVTQESLSDSVGDLSDLDESHSPILTGLSGNNFIVGHEYQLDYSNGRKITTIWDGEHFRLKPIGK